MVAALILGGCGSGDSKDANQPKDANSVAEMPTTTTAPGLRADGLVREPAVAGLWYPDKVQDLARQITGLLSSTAAGVSGKVRAMIVPHAGIRFSGLTAAVAYKQLMGQDVRTVVILAPSHTATFPGASIPDVKAYRTPLGLTALSPKAAELAKVHPFKPAPKVTVRRPDWWTQASKSAPPAGQETPHTWEHSLEIQLPFLQWILGTFQLVPVVYGTVDEAAAAEVLDKQIDDETVIVASSDLSHHHPYDMARSLDAWCVKAVREMDIKSMRAQEACGKSPILTVMHLAKKHGWKPHILDYRNSGDLRGGRKDSVVGYMAAVFVEEGAVKSQPLSEADRTGLLKLARQTITNAVTKKPLPRVDPSKLSAKLLKPKACFVTLKLKADDTLRGCIGQTLPIKRLFIATMESAVNAALRDRRFKPVSAGELDEIAIEISVLTVPKPIYYNTPNDLLKALRPNVDGVILEVPVVKGNRRGTARSVYLPSVWKDIPEPVEFMNRLSVKAGLRPEMWRQPQASVRTFQVEEFGEPKE